MLALFFFCCCWPLPKVKFLDKMYSSENQFLRKVFLDFKGPLSIMVCQKPARPARGTSEVLAKEL